MASLESPITVQYRVHSSKSEKIQDTHEAISHAPMAGGFSGGKVKYPYNLLYELNSRIQIFRFQANTYNCAST